jgi:hypothetical protein
MHLAIGIFFLGLLFSGLCVLKATQHRKDPNVLFYLGNVDKTGRKYVWAALLALLIALIAFFSYS